MQDVRRWIARGGVVAFGVIATIGVINANQAGSQTTPSLPPGFTLPTFPTIPPPPTMPPLTTSSTSPPPTMPPSTTTTSGPPPTMPPTTIGEPELPENIEESIERLIDELEEFGDQFADVIDALQNVLNRF